MWRKFCALALIITAAMLGVSLAAGCGCDELEQFGSFGSLYFYKEDIEAIVVKEDEDGYWYYNVLLPSLAEANKIKHWKGFEERLDRLPAGREITPAKDQPVFAAIIPDSISEALFKKSFKPWLYRGAKSGATDWLFCQVTEDGDVKNFKSAPESAGKYYMKSKKDGYGALIPLGVEDLFFLFPPGADKRIKKTSYNTVSLTPVWDYTLPEDIEGVVRYEVSREGSPKILRKLYAGVTYEVKVIQEFPR